MIEKNVRSPLPSFKYNAEMSRFQTEIDTANSEIDTVNGMSDEDLSLASQSAFNTLKSFYEESLEEISLSGESYKGEKEDLETDYSKLKLLSASEWKEQALENAICKKEFYENEIDYLRKECYVENENLLSSNTYLAHN